MLWQVRTMFLMCSFDQCFVELDYISLTSQCFHNFSSWSEVKINTWSFWPQFLQPKWWIGSYPTPLVLWYIIYIIYNGKSAKLKDGYGWTNYFNTIWLPSGSANPLVSQALTGIFGVRSSACPKVWCFHSWVLHISRPKSGQNHVTWSLLWRVFNLFYFDITVL